MVPCDRKRRSRVFGITKKFVAVKRKRNISVVAYHIICFRNHAVPY